MSRRQRSAVPSVRRLALQGGLLIAAASITSLPAAVALIAAAAIVETIPSRHP